MNQYHIYEKIGKGKHSVVYKGRKKKTIQYYAVKSVDKSQKARVLQEVRTMHALDHSNVLKFYAWYETSNHLWLILEYCVGGDLMSLLRQDVHLPEASVHDFGRDLVVALQYLHTNSIIYCDIKPSNVLLDENGRLKLGGFGLSRRLSDINKSAAASIPPARRGTPCYMAPELFSEAAPHSTASDLWSLGCVLYECATGRPPFMNSSFNQLANDILNTDPAPVQGASQAFSHLLYRLLDKNPATRIKWPELVSHPFWKQPLQLLELPPEPAFEGFVRQHNLVPSSAQDAARQGAQMLRESVDVLRLSRIAGNNLEKEGDPADYTAAQAGQGDITIDCADAELDFEERRDEGDDEDVPGPSSSSDDGNLIDQSASAAQAEAGKFNALSRTAAAAKPGSLQREAWRSSEVVAGKGSSAAAGLAALLPGAASDGGSELSADTIASNRGPAGFTRAEAPSEDPAATAAAAVAAAAAHGEEAAAGQQGGEGAASPLQHLLWHPTDSAVKPIVANRRIERLPEPKFEDKALPFEPLSLAALLQTDQKELEGFLTHIYRAVASAAPLKDKINVLAYFESLCTDTNAANVLINSSLTVLFVRMMRNSKAPLLRVRLASVLGLLVRHATFISEELASTQVVDILVEALRDKNERIRRRVMATLGELLFYISTQQQDSGTSSVADASALWGINAATVAAVGRLLRPGEDEVVQHYAVKTIENICSQGGDWARKFATQDMVSGLVVVYNSAANDNLRATALSSLARLLRSQPDLMGALLQKHGPELLTAGMASSSSKVQVAAVNITNMALLQPGPAQVLVAGGPQLVPLLVGLLDHSLLLLRTKALLGVLLMCRISCMWLLEFCQNKLLQSMEHLQREVADTQLQEALALLRQEAATAAQGVAEGLAAQVAAAAGGGGGGGGGGARGSSGSAGVTTLDGSCEQLQLLLYLTSSPMFREAAVAPGVLSHLATCLVATAAPGLQVAGLAEFRAALMRVLEQLSQHAELLVRHYADFVAHLLPALCGVVASSSESGDMRFFCLRMVSDLLATFLLDAELYDPRQPIASSAAVAVGVGQQQQQQQQQQQGRQSLSRSTAALNEALREHVLPLVPLLLVQEDPMPLYALKLLGGIMEVNQQYVSDVQGLGLTTTFFNYLSLEHPNNNVHNIRLCRQLVAAGCLTPQQLQEMDVAEQVAAVLVYAHANNVEPFLEPVLDLVQALCAQDQAVAAAGGSSSAAEGLLSSSFLQQLPVVLDLVTHSEALVGVAAAQCLAQLVRLYPHDTASWLLSDDGAAVLAAALAGQHLALPSAAQGGEPGAAAAAAGGASPPAALQQHLLSALRTAAAAQPQLQRTSGEVQQLLAVLKGMQSIAAADGTDSLDLQEEAAAVAKQLARLCC